MMDTSFALPTYLPPPPVMISGHSMYNNPPILDLRIGKPSPAPSSEVFKLSSPLHTSTLIPECSPEVEVSSTEKESSITRSGPRPFKAYPKDPLGIALMGLSVGQVLDTDSETAYAEFRRNMLSKISQQEQIASNGNMRRHHSINNTFLNNDPDYMEKRKKNNEAAKRSRAARKAKEDEMAVRCAFLEQENLQLKFRLEALKKEKMTLQKMLYS